MEICELVICNVQANLGRYQDAPNFQASEMSTRIVDENDRNVLTAVSGSKFEHKVECFPESNSLQASLMQVLSANANSPLQPVNNIYCDEVGSSVQHSKSKFDTQIAKLVYMRSTFYPSATLPKSLQPPTEAMFIKMLRIVDVPANYEIHFEQPTVMRFESLAYTCTVSKAKNAYASSTIADLSAQQLSSPSKDTTVCMLTSSTLTRFYESSSFYSPALIALPTSMSCHQNLHKFLIEVNYFASNLKKFLLVYKKMLLEHGTSKLTKYEMIGFQMLSGWTSYYIDGINRWISLFEQESQNGQVPMLSLASATVATSCTAVSTSLSIQSCSMTYMSTGIPLRIKKLLWQAIGDELIITTTTIASMNDKEKIVNSSLSFQCGYVNPGKICTTSVVTPSQALVVQTLSDSNQLNKSTNCTSIAISRASPSTNQVKVHSSLSLIPAMIPNQNYFERYYNILLIMSHLSCIPLHSEQFEDLQLLPCSMQLQLRTISDFMPILRQKDLREEIEVIDGTPSHHGCTEMHSTDPQSSLRLKQASVICQPLEESRPLDRGVALFRGGKPSTQKSDTSSTSSEDDSDSDTDSGHSGAEASLQNPTSSHETSHTSNGATNVQPFSDAPPPLIMSGGETDRYVRRSKSPAALVTKSSEQLLHSQGASSELPRNKQVPHKSPFGSGGSQSSYVQPKLECYEDENIPQPIHCVRQQILEQAEEEVSMRPQHDNNAGLAQPQVPSNENHPPQSSVVVSCSVPLSDSITGCAAISGFGANVEAAVSSASALPECQVQAVVNHELQLAIVQRRLRGLVLQMRFRCDRISHLLRRSQNNLYNDQLQAIRLALRDIVREMRHIAHRWRVCELRFQRIRNLSVHTDIRDRLFELRQLRALHACHSLLRLQPRLEQINGLLLELLSQLQQANARLAVAQAPQAPQANAQQAVMLPALLLGPGNVMPFQAQVEEDSPATHTDMH